ncbi:uncharacterized protein LOC131664648 isoform X2 [Phymastichus coffea]|uniref:uncharacterized protein LOC131664648 isoform X2 n=1 Tax=Phymastichus coffea TaxID=108790 RepID=UPI00273A92F9|nr:uncharacterized protein LOC131664648 isoform X2 [Phymastichus coffea]
MTRSRACLRQRMRVAELWTGLLMLAQALASAQYAGPFPGQRRPALRPEPPAYGGKRASSLAEPSCEELRAMWRYSKRQSRAAETSNELPVYRDPFSYNVWEAYPRHLHSSGYRDEYAGSAPATSRHGGGAPIYGKVVQAPERSRLRNGKLGRVGFDDINKYYGTLSREPPSREGLVNSRMPGGVAKSIPRQTGRFQTLKNMILEERAKELKEQRKAEDMAARAAARAAALKEMTSGDRRQLSDSGNANVASSLGQLPKSEYFGSEGQYVADVPDIQQSLTSDHYGARGYMLR